MFNKLFRMFSKQESSQSKAPSGSSHLKLTLETAEFTETHKQIRDLGKEATQYKQNKDWDSAINCLQKQKKLMPLVNTEYTSADYLRLPKFLQRSGRMNDAVVEIDEILSHIKPSYKNQIYSGIALIYLREKREKEAYLYGRLSDAWQAVMYKARPRIAFDDCNKIGFWKENIRSFFKKNPDKELETSILSMFEEHLDNIDALHDTFVKQCKKKPLQIPSYLEHLTDSKREEDKERLIRSEKNEFEKAFSAGLFSEADYMVSIFEDSLRSLLELED